MDGSGKAVGDPLERVRYFNGQLLTPEDLQQEQAYLREKDRRHNRALHGWGVAYGLEVRARDLDELHVLPGVAIDQYGNELHVGAMTPVGLVGVVDGIVAIRYGEEQVGESRIREVVDVAVIETVERCWVPLATIVRTARGELEIDPSIRRRLHRDRAVDRRP